MKSLRYLRNVTTIAMDSDTCVGCKACTEVCPHGVLVMEGKKAALVDPDGCMECGACVVNCPTGAVSVTPGVGCAAYIISGWIHGPENASCGGPNSGCC